MSLGTSRFDKTQVNILVFKEFKSLRGRAPDFRHLIPQNSYTWLKRYRKLNRVWANKISIIFFKCCFIKFLDGVGGCSLKKKKRTVSFRETAFLALPLKWTTCRQNYHGLNSATF